MWAVPSSATATPGPDAPSEDSRIGAAPRGLPRPAAPTAAARRTRQHRRRRGQGREPEKRTNDACGVLSEATPPPLSASNLRSGRRWGHSPSGPWCRPGRCGAGTRVSRTCPTPPLPAPSTTASSVAALVRRQLGVAVGAEQPQVLSAVVAGVAVDVIKHEVERQVVPDRRHTAQRTKPLLVGEDVVPLRGPRVHGPSVAQPVGNPLLTLGRALAGVAAVLPQPTARKDRTTSRTLEHVPTLDRATDRAA